MSRSFAAIALALLVLATALPVRALEPTRIGLNRQSTGTYYVPGEISGYGELAFLVDTGSSYLVINETVLAGLEASGAAVFSRDLNGIMANGTETRVPLYWLSAIKLGEHCWVHDVEAAVFPGATRSILGMNVLQRLAPITFSIEPPVLALHQCSTRKPGGSAVIAADAAPGAAVPLPQGTPASLP